jgi:hypothetical protein
MTSFKVQTRNSAHPDWATGGGAFATEAEARADAAWFTCETRIITSSDPVNCRFDFTTRRPVGIKPDPLPATPSDEARLKALKGIEELREQVARARAPLKVAPKPPSKVKAVKAIIAGLILLAGVIYLIVSVSNGSNCTNGPVDPITGTYTRTCLNWWNDNGDPNQK